MNRVEQLILGGLDEQEAIALVAKQLLSENRQGLSADCKLDPMIVVACFLDKEHPCDRCNMDRNECRGFPRLDTLKEYESQHSRT